MAGKQTIAFAPVTQQEDSLLSSLSLFLGPSPDASTLTSNVIDEKIADAPTTPYRDKRNISKTQNWTPEVSTPATMLYSHSRSFRNMDDLATPSLVGGAYFNPNFSPLPYLPSEGASNSPFSIRQNDNYNTLPCENIFESREAWRRNLHSRSSRKRRDGECEVTVSLADAIEDCVPCEEKTMDCNGSSNVRWSFPVISGSESGANQVPAIGPILSVSNSSVCSFSKVLPMRDSTATVASPLRRTRKLEDRTTSYHTTPLKRRKSQTFITIQKQTENIPPVPKVNIIKQHRQQRPRIIKKTKKMKKAKGQICNCKKSRCLKLYCDCFAASKLCGSDCKCRECENDGFHEQSRLAAIKLVKIRNPFAFAPRVADSGKELAQHKKGCHCKKSMCIKKYCECYQSGISCTEGICKCENCQNTPGNAAKLHGVGATLPVQFVVRKGKTENKIKKNVFTPNALSKALPKISQLLQKTSSSNVKISKVKKSLKKTLDTKKAESLFAEQECDNLPICVADEVSSTPVNESCWFSWDASRDGVSTGMFHTSIENQPKRVVPVQKEIDDTLSFFSDNDIAKAGSKFENFHRSKLSKDKRLRINASPLVDLAQLPVK